MKLGDAIRLMCQVADPDDTGNMDIEICFDLWVQDDFYDYGIDEPIDDVVWAQACQIFEGIVPSNESGMLFLNDTIDELRGS